MGYVIEHSILSLILASNLVNALKGRLNRLKVIDFRFLSGFLHYMFLCSGGLEKKHAYTQFLIDKIKVETSCSTRIEDFKEHTPLSCFYLNLVLYKLWVTGTVLQSTLHGPCGPRSYVLGT